MKYTVLKKKRKKDKKKGREEGKGEREERRGRRKRKEKGGREERKRRVGRSLFLKGRKSLVPNLATRGCWIASDPALPQRQKSGPCERSSGAAMIISMELGGLLFFSSRYH